MKFCNIPINVFNNDNFLNWDDGYKHYCTLNAQIIRLANENEKLFNIVQKTNNSIDGTWPYWAFRIFTLKKNINKVSGSDMLPFIIRKCIKENKRVFFFRWK